MPKNFDLRRTFIKLYGFVLLRFFQLGEKMKKKIFTVMFVSVLFFAACGSTSLFEKGNAARETDKVKARGYYQEACEKENHFEAPSRVRVTSLLSVSQRMTTFKDSLSALTTR